MDDIQSRDWGLLLLDEVHVCPAKIFRRTLELVRAHSTLGLTATLVREDDLIKDLSFLLGPKLYEANWMDLTARGFLAKVLCAEVWCPMTSEFYSEYLEPKGAKSAVKRLKQRIFALNPNKIAACRHLVNVHKDRGDKILIFSDDIFALKSYAEHLKVEPLYGDTPAQERLRIISSFKTSPTDNVICISSVGDTSIDLPECTVIIQVAGHFGSRRQEAQRLGRVLRPKQGPQLYEGFNAFFYSLVSTETSEMFFAHRRQRYLQDQGYTYRVLDALLDWDAPLDQEKDRSVYLTKLEQKDLLTRILDSKLTKDDKNWYRNRANLDLSEEYDGNYDYYDEDDMPDFSQSSASQSNNAASSVAMRRAERAGFGDLSGASGMAYGEHGVYRLNK